jgi:MFS family permease
MTTTTGTTSADQQDQTRSLRFLALLGLPALGLTFAVTAVSSYAPVLIGARSSPVVVGAVVGGEGLFGLVVPFLVGGVPHRRGDRVAGRVRVLLVAAPAAAAALLVLGVVGSLPVIAVAAGLYFAAHFSYLVPYQALYADVIPDEQSGRSRSAESVWRLAGAGAALIGGGFLLDVWTGLPFVVAAALLLAVTAVLPRVIPSAVGGRSPSGGGSTRQSVAAMRTLLADRRIRQLSIANAVWNFTLSGLRAFVVLYFVAGLGRSATFVSGVIFPIVAVGLAVAAPLAGKLADRHGHARVLQVAVPIYGAGLVLPGFSHASWVVAVVPIVSAAAATVMTIPFAALMTMMPDEHHGDASALFTVSRGVGGLLGPLTVGVAVELLRGTFASTHGYAAMWPVIGVATLLTWPLIRSLGRSS